MEKVFHFIVNDSPGYLVISLTFKNAFFSLIVKMDH